MVEDITRGEWAECLAIVGGLLLLGNSRYDVYEFKDRNKESDLAGLEPICRELRIAAQPPEATDQGDNGNAQASRTLARQSGH